MPNEKSKKGKKRKKKKGSAEALPQEQHEKQVLYLPKREPGERFPELQIDTNEVRLIDARVFSTAVSTSSPYQWREFLRMQLPSEKVSKRVYNLGMGPNMEVTFAKLRDQGPWMLYRSYIRADELTMMDYKECKLFYLQYMPQNLINNKSSLSLQYITDWLSIAYLMRDELERRRMGMEAFGGGTCLRASNLGIAPLYATHRKSFAKEQMKNFKIWPQMIAEAAPDIVKSMKHRLLFVENVIRFGGMSKIVKEFISQNREWVDERLKLSDICKQIILGKNQIEELNRIRPFNSVYQLASELHELPPSVGHAVHFCRALKDLTLVIGKQEIVRKESKNGTIPLLVRPTRYEYKPSPVTAYKEAADMVEPLPLCFHEAPRRAPSLNSLSGFSSDSAASTATESPKDWQHNWKMQTMHRDMEHRLMDSSIQNPLEERQLGELEASQRIADEVDLRISQLNDNRLFETVFGSRSDLSPYYQELLFDKEIQIYRDVRQTKAISAQMDHLLGSMALGDDDGLELKLVDYVFNELLRMAPECGKDPYEGLAITNGWKTMIDQGLLKEKSKEHLKMVISSHHSWVNSNFLSRQSVVPRCDQQPHDVTALEELPSLTTASNAPVCYFWILTCAFLCVVCAIIVGFLIKSH